MAARLPRILLVSGVAALAAGCEVVDYYWQGVAGQVELLARARPIDEVLAQTGDGPLALRLERVRAIREFASRELALPDNGSYRRYTDLGRPFVVWNVFAAPELALAPRQWCFPVAGCVNYRGYFDEAGARGEAARLAAAGDDVHVDGVPAYSTLGWFDDPVLSSFVRYPDTALARLVFHELAHQVVYVKDDSTFNESFATAVEEAGLARWIAAQPEPERARLAAERARSDHLRAEFKRLVRRSRAELEAIYAGGAGDAEKRREKAAVFAALRAGYERAKAGEPGLAGYDRWFDGERGRGPNNASLAAVALYDRQLPAFRALLADVDGDLPAFYARVRALAAQPKPARDEALAGWAAQAKNPAGSGG